MPTPVRRVPAVGQPARSAARRPPHAGADVVAIHRPGEDPVGRRVEPLDELAALVVEIADDRRPAVGLDVAAEALVEVGLAAIGRHRQLAREREPVEPEPVDELDLEVVPGDGHRPGRGRCRDRHHRPDRVRAARARPRARPCRRASRRRRDRDARSRGRRAAATARVPGRGSRPPGRRRRTAGPVRGSSEVGPVVP